LLVTHFIYTPRFVPTGSDTWSQERTEWAGELLGTDPADLARFGSKLPMPYLYLVE
jgi:hypothetical protein